jgi:Flp pilus assembly protein TadD
MAALLHDGQTARAEQMLQQATTRYPLDPSSFTYYAIAAEQLNHLDAAAAPSRRRARRQRRAVGVKAMRIGMALRLNDLASTVRWLQNAADANPSDARCSPHADAQLRTGDSNRARETIARGLALDVKNPTLLTLSLRANVPTSKTSK